MLQFVKFNPVRDEIFSSKYSHISLISSMISPICNAKKLIGLRPETVFFWISQFLRLQINPKQNLKNQ